ncbi:unnamed protein product [Adineta steineri]|uniref:Peptidase S1 domain-containing protein n=1 Tax=Adineta steineri TaxID=433720 RepID=A0A819ZJ22_9BILA|nr:unnamed protein product [Adineta steineri]CAF4173299.1 unnamed protein product [Adineta steineri]
MHVMFLFIFIFHSIINLTLAANYSCNTASTCGCSTVSTVVTSRIIGGEDAADHTWNWIVSFQSNGDHRCGATLLTSEYAVTAAHCTVALLPLMPNLTIVAGTNDLSDSSNTAVQQRSIINMFTHPNFIAGRYVNDIAILQFAPLNIASDFNIGFICLPQSYQDPFQTGDNLIAIGWGVTSTASGAAVSNSLQQVTVQAFSSTSADCERTGISNATVQFCAGVSGGGKDTCQGDSGGPLMAFVDNTWVLAGITSSGQGCAQAGYPGIYTRVSPFISFIDSILGIPFNGSDTPSQVLVTTTVQTQDRNMTNKSGSISIFCFLSMIFCLLLI